MTFSSKNHWNLSLRSLDTQIHRSPSLLTFTVSESGPSEPENLPTEAESFFRSYAQVAGTVLHPVIRYPCELKLNCSGGNKSEICSVRFQAGELPLVRTKAELAEVSVNSYIRAVALGSDYKAPLHDGLRKILLATNLELTRQGNNLNQIARHLHMGKLTSEQAANLVDSVRVPLVSTLRVVKNALVQEPPRR